MLQWNGSGWCNGACVMVQLIQQTAFPLCREYLVSAYHGTTTSAEPLFIVRAGLSNPKGLMDAIPFETVLEWLMFEKEVVHLRWGEHPPLLAAPLVRLSMGGYI